MMLYNPYKHDDLRQLVGLNNICGTNLLMWACSKRMESVSALKLIDIFGILCKPEQIHGNGD